MFQWVIRMSFCACPRCLRLAWRLCCRMRLLDLRFTTHKGLYRLFSSARQFFFLFFGEVHFLPKWLISWFNHTHTHSHTRTGTPLLRKVTELASGTVSILRELELFRESLQHHCPHGNMQIPIWYFPPCNAPKPLKTCSVFTLDLSGKTDF